MSATPSPSLLSSPILDDAIEKIRVKPVSWDSLARAGIVDQNDVQLLQPILTAPNQQKVDEVYDEQGSTYAALYARLLSGLSRNEPIQFTLVLLGDMVEQHEDRLKLFFSPLVSTDLPGTSSSGTSNPIYAGLTKHASSSDTFTSLKSILLLSIFLAADPEPAQQPISQVLDSLAKLLPRSPARTTQEQTSIEYQTQSLALQCLGTILRVAQARTVVIQEGDSKDSGNVVVGIANVLKANPDPQTQYLVGFCLWLLSFDREAAQALNEKYAVIPLLAGVAKNAVKEKVTRVIIATFRNLVTFSPSTSYPPMLVSKVLPYLDSLGIKLKTQSDDNELKEDVAFLRQELKSGFEGLTTYDEYTSELQSGQLTWSPTHTSDDFWKDNASKLEERDLEQLKRLVEILNTSDDPKVIAVAVSDIGQYLRWSENGKPKAEKLGAKAKIMELMAHPDSDVRYRSLGTVQRFVSHAF